VRLSWSQALSWRTGRQLLDPIGTLPTADVVRRLGGVQAQVASTAELAVRVRQQRSEPGDVVAAMAEGSLIKTWAMRARCTYWTWEESGDAIRIAWFHETGRPPRDAAAAEVARLSAIAGRDLEMTVSEV
jgi:hypothetical protein